MTEQDKGSGIDPRNVELARLLGQVEGAKKLSESQIQSQEEPVITDMHATSMKELVTFLSKNATVIDVFDTRKQ
jgi:hypothetical protein